MAHIDLEYLPREKIIEIQERRFKKQIKYVFEKSKFYQRNFQKAGIAPTDIRSLDDLKYLPFTTKDELRGSQLREPPFGEHLCVPKEDVIWCPTTSGTSGRPLILPRTHEDIEKWTNLMARAYRMYEVGEKDVVQITTSYNYVLSTLIAHLGIQKVAKVINAGTGNTKRQIRMTQLLGTTVLVGTCSYLFHIARVAEEMGVNLAELKIRMLTGGGEIGLGCTSGKQKFRKAFPTVKHVLDQWGPTDVGTPIGAECLKESGMHIFEDCIIVEIINPDTKEPAGEGEIGEVVLTDLISKTAPLIRFAVKDLAMADFERCSCGGSFMRLPGGIRGRADDMVIVRGVNIFPSAVEDIIRKIKGVDTNYLIIVDRPEDTDIITIKVEVNKKTTDVKKVEESVKSELIAGLGLRPNVEVLSEGTLPVFYTKTIRVVDKRRGDTLEKVENIARAQERFA